MVNRTTCFCLEIACYFYVIIYVIMSMSCVLPAAFVFMLRRLPAVHSHVCVCVCVCVCVLGVGSGRRRPT